MPKKKIKVDNYDDSWMYILLLTTLTILTYSLATYTFKLTDIRHGMALPPSSTE